MEGWMDGWREGGRDGYSMPLHPVTRIVSCQGEIDRWMDGGMDGWMEGGGEGWILDALAPSHPHRVVSRRER